MVPISNLGNKVSGDDVARVRDIRNPPEHEPGFGPDNGGGDFSDMFGGGDIAFDDLMAGDFGSPNIPGQTLGGAGLGSGDIFGSQGNIFGQQGSMFGQPAVVQTPKEYKKDTMDKMMDSSGEALVSIGQIILEMFKSIKNRNADDFAYYSRNLIITGGVASAASIVLGVIGIASGIRFLSFAGLSGQILGCGMLTFGTGLAGMGFAAIKVASMAADSRGTVSQLPDISTLIEGDSADDYEDNIGSILDDLFGDDAEDLFGESDDGASAEAVFNPSLDDMNYTSDQLDYTRRLENIQENQYISREVLFNTFKDFFPVNTPNFADKIQLSQDSDDFQNIETICLKALSNVAKCEMEEVNSKLESVKESFFSYELRLKRIRGINKLEDIAREMEAYFRESSSDKSVNATVDIEGDFYKIVVTKGVKAVITFGDMFRQPYVCEFFLDNKNRLPFIVGISELGDVILEDAKPFDTMMIAGKPRSGKSWYVLNVLMALMMFNSPEAVQFIVIDPKESNLFKTLSLMPHVCGLHSDENIIQIMRDIIDNEGARRKKLLSDNRCDDIWALWKKGIKLPVLYLIIDEVITIKANLGALDKEFDSLMQVIMSQLPSQGIRLLFVPHRATGVINKTNRTMVSFSAAVRANAEDVKDTLGIQKWTRSLVNQGDVAIKLGTRDDPMYIRGGAITTSDEDNSELILNAAKAFYKMGIDIPRMTLMETACNRDEEYIRKELSSGNNRIQYNANHIFDDIE